MVGMAPRDETVNGIIRWSMLCGYQMFAQAVLCTT